MTLKQIDDKTAEVKKLSSLYNKSSNKRQKSLIFEEIEKIKSGYDAEKENAYYLDVRLRDNKNLLLINDIRLECDGMVAQIDHMIITRFGIELLESKSSKGQMTINKDGSISLKNRNRATVTLPNPLEQSVRHAKVIRAFLDKMGLMPKRISALGGVNIESRVLISPKTTLTNEKLPDCFFRADSFITARNKEIDKMSLLATIPLASKAYSIGTAHKIANAIIGAHKPLHINYEDKFKINNMYKQEDGLQKKVKSNENFQEEQTCPRCKKGILVKRHSNKKESQLKYGSGEFYGCNRYPKCRYTVAKIGIK